MDFQNLMERTMENNMNEELTMKIGDLVKDRDVNLELLVDQSTKRLRHLHRLMNENPTMKLKRVDDMMLYFELECGHEFLVVWTSLVEDVAEMIEEDKMKVRCKHGCVKTSKQKEEELVKPAPTTNNQPITQKEKPAMPTLKQSDMDNAKNLTFKFLSPNDEKVKERRVVRLAARIQLRLNAYKAACEKGDTFQAINAGKALKAGVNYMRREFGVPCAVKMVV